MSNSYVLENDGVITASKLKCFLKNPQEYYLQYVKKIELDEEDKRCFVIGTAIDDLLSYGEEYFLEKYYIDDGYLVDDLKLKLSNEYGNNVDGNLIKNMKLPELRYYFYKLETPRIRLTDKEGKDVLGMYREIKRQPLADYSNSNYEKQKVIECKYKGLTLRGRLDRFNAKESMIRDWKTTGRFDSFEYDMEETYDYVMSMAFYYTLAKIEHGLDCDVILDVVHKNSPYQFVSYKLDKQILLKKMIEKVKPGLDELIKAYETDTRLPIDPLSGMAIPRSEATKSPYYPYMDCAIQKTFISPM